MVVTSKIVRENGTVILFREVQIGLLESWLIMTGHTRNSSFGVPTFPDDATSLSELLALADQAMFFVKERGKNSVSGITFGDL